MLPIINIVHEDNPSWLTHLNIIRQLPSVIYLTIYLTRECLKCYSCDDPMDCANPRQQLCPPNNECYTVAQNYDTKLNGLRKGCAATCDRVNIEGMLCRTCKSELCNGKTGLGKAFEKPVILPPQRPTGSNKDASGKNRMYIFIFHSDL
uniref:Uncharacterized protein n=1 Tax=Wuchereria bancrofti TaxID=6293 RepID=A0A1I8EMZ0_WUCBA